MREKRIGFFHFRTQKPVFPDSFPHLALLSRNQRHQDLRPIDMIRLSIVVLCTGFPAVCRDEDILTYVFSHIQVSRYLPHCQQAL